jgi:hypothetical protein
MKTEIPGDKLPGPLEGDDEVVEARVVTGNAGTESFCEGGVVLHHLPRFDILVLRLIPKANTLINYQEVSQFLKNYLAFFVKSKKFISCRSENLRARNRNTVNELIQDIEVGLFNILL